MKLTSSWSPARVEGRSWTVVRGPFRRDRRDPRANSRRLVFVRRRGTWEPSACGGGSQSEPKRPKSSQRTPKDYIDKLPINRPSGRYVNARQMLSHAREMLDKRSIMIDKCSTMLDECSITVDTCSIMLDMWSIMLDTCSIMLDICSIMADKCSILLDNCSINTWWMFDNAWYMLNNAQ